MRKMFERTIKQNAHNQILNFVQKRENEKVFKIVLPRFFKLIIQTKSYFVKIERREKHDGQRQYQKNPRGKGHDSTASGGCLRRFTGFDCTNRMQIQRALDGISHRARQSSWMQD